MSDDGYVVWEVYDSEELLDIVTFRVISVGIAENPEETSSFENQQDTLDGNRVIQVFFG